MPFTVQDLYSLETYLVLQILRTKQFRYARLIDSGLLVKYLVKIRRLKKFYSVKSRCRVTLRSHSTLRLTGTSRFFTKKAVELTIFPGITRAS